MALIPLTPPEKAEGKLAELYASAEQFFGTIPQNVRLLGVSPAVLENQLYFAQYFMKHPTLSAPLLAMVRMLVARACKSEYCDSFNVGMLKQRVGLSDEQIHAARTDPAKAPLNDKDKAMLLFVLKATAEPQAVSADDLAKLRGLGWADTDMFDAVAHGARAVATNILFDAFKIDQETA
jgi:alkylhydroperoxidase family enzyme